MHCKKKSLKNNDKMEFYRNKEDIISFEGEHIDADSLWKKNGELMVLVDEDRYASAPFDEKKFYKVEINKIH